jgi:hypothetical protein
MTEKSASDSPVRSSFHKLLQTASVRMRKKAHPKPDAAAAANDLTTSQEVTHVDANVCRKENVVGRSHH